MESGVIHSLILVALCCLTLGGLSEGKHGKPIPYTLIIGTVRKANDFVSGASVVLECGDGISSKHMFRKEAKTDKHGDFQVHLPASASKHFKSFKACSVKLMSSSSEPNCAVASTISTTLIHLNSRKDKGAPRIFSAGVLTFSPLKQSSRCSKKRNLRARTDEEVTSAIYTISSQHAEQTQQLLPQSLFFPFPPNPFQPPVIPPNPLLPPPSIFPPVPGLTPPPSGILPPVPGLTPPPSGILPPVPGLTPPPSGILPPVPGLTPPPSGILPPIPGLTPPPPASIFPPLPGIPNLPGVPTIPGIPAFASPPPPSLLPPFPFPPGFPGIPPASKSSAKP